MALERVEEGEKEVRLSTRVREASRRGGGDSGAATRSLMLMRWIGVCCMMVKTTGWRLDEEKRGEGGV